MESNKIIFVWGKDVREDSSSVEYRERSEFRKHIQRYLHNHIHLRLELYFILVFALRAIIAFCFRY